MCRYAGILVRNPSATSVDSAATANIAIAPRYLTNALPLEYFEDLFMVRPSPGLISRRQTVSKHLVHIYALSDEVEARADETATGWPQGIRNQVLEV
jgi:hypothetical protein